MRNQDIIDVLEDFAPLGLAEEWDAVGLQVGDPQQECNTVALALDLTAENLAEAQAVGANMIVVHHPILMRATKTIRYDQPLGHLIQQLCTHKLSLYVMHTNLDSTRGGLNDHLANAIGLINVRSLLPAPATTPERFQGQVVGLGRIGELQEGIPLATLATRLQEELRPEALRIIGPDQRQIQSVALCSGSGGSLVHQAINSGADCYVTGDVKYHQALDAEAAGLCILDAGHYATEISSIAIMQSVLTTKFGNDLNIVRLEKARDPLRAFHSV